MTLLQSILMGIIQGLTEFLPVSSSGHLALFKALFGFEASSGILFDVMLHLGTLAAIFVVYYKDIAQLILEGFSILRDLFINLGRLLQNLFIKGTRRKYIHVMEGAYRRFVWLVLISTVPTGILGILLKDFIERASDNTLIPGICLLVTAVILFVSDRIRAGKKNAQTATIGDAVTIGVVQGIATLPGISRSGSTITAALACGFSRKFAVKYSFIMSIPAILGAAVLELKDLSEALADPTPFWYYLVGMAVSAVVGYVCIRLMLVIVNRRRFTWFSVYCAIVGVASVVLYFLRR